MTTQKLTQKQQDILVGCLLGDANLQTFNEGKTWRLRMIHKAAHQGYLFHKYEIVKDFVTSPPVYGEVFDERTQKTYKRWSFNSVTTGSLRFLAQKFYVYDKIQQKWVKQVPSDIGNLLTPEGLAYWYMDDGALKWKGKSNAVRLCTDSFSEQNVNLLREVLKNKFQLETSIQRKDGCPRINIKERSYQTLRSLVLSYLHPNMYYKFPDGNYGVLENEDLALDLEDK
jgi:hypothetical protein